MNLVGGGSTAGMPSILWSVQTRPAVLSDRECVLSMVPRMVASSPAHWRNPRKVRAAYEEVIESILGLRRADAALLIAEDGHGTPGGFILAVAATNSYTHERHGHVAQLVVFDPQDIAVGLALIVAVEEWARSRGHRLLTMSEFWANHPARAICPKSAAAKKR